MPIDRNIKRQDYGQLWAEKIKGDQDVFPTLREVFQGLVNFIVITINQTKQYNKYIEK